ncbi:unnamed protein product [Hermetia illucens]|uniref:HAT C-terminal dimerisation domain-containing protein n=1 Tax=Hermetia illucens TaxID=343691 RepID=A0A7R8UI32_HERIL|nr:unnamed protein product [Hermetia illucens]
MKRFFEVVSKDPQRASSSSEPDSESTEGINESPEKNKECEKSKKQKYEQKYVKYWESEFKWLSEGTKGCHYAFCKVCSVDVYIGKMGKSAIKSHANTQIHTKNAGTISLNLVQQNIEPLFSLASKTAVIDAEIMMAVFVAEHNLAFQIMGHLPQFVNKITPDSNIAKKVKCSRTKMVNILRNVLGISYIEEIVDLLNANKFSLIIDESTDISLVKTLCLVVRVCKNFKVHDLFFDLIEVESADASSLFSAVINSFTKNNIMYKQNMIGFAADGANIMMGRNHSVSTLLKADINDLFVLKCVCHSFHLSASYACEKLPGEVEDLARNIFNYLKSSSKRLKDFSSLQYFFEFKANKILHPSQTRWLSLSAVVSRLIEQYDVLIAYFSIAVKEENLQTAKNILTSLKDPITKLYLLFLEFALPFFIKLNKLFQSESSQIHKLHSSVKEIVVTLLECFVTKDYITMFLDSTSEFNLPPECLLDLESIYLGIKVECFLITNEINVIEIDTFKNKCRNFYIEAVLQILKRFDLNNSFFRNLSIIAPDNVYACTYKSIAPLLQQVPRLLADNIQEIDSEYRTLINFVKDKEQILDIEEFWRMVARIEIGNEQAFPNLVKLVFAILSFPHSSANVERVFSQVNLMKTKIRKRLENATIKACLQTKGLLKLQNSDCTNFKVTTEMRKKCNKAMYDIPK